MELTLSDSYNNSAITTKNSSHPITATTATFNQEAGDKYRWQYAILYLIPLATIWGNVFVCLAVYVEQRLRHRFNLFLVSLAVSDLMSALFIMPASAWRMISDKPWNKTICLIWHSLDIMLTATTIIHLCSISLDRYLALRRPFKRARIRSQTHNHLMLRIGMAWLIPFLIAGPLFAFALYRRQLTDKIDELTSSSQDQLTNTSISGSQPIPAKSYKGCGPNDRVFVLTAILVTFVLPLTIMVITYILTVRMLKTHMNQLKAIQLGGGSGVSQIHSYRRDSKLINDRLLGNNLDGSRVQGHQTTSDRLRVGGDGQEDQSEPSDCYSTTNTKVKRLGGLSATWSESTNTSDQRQLRATRSQYGGTGKSRSANDGASSHRSKINRIHKGQRAVRVIGVLFAIFILCYLPFFIVFSLDVFCATCKQWTERLMAHFEWLGYTGSMLNPVVYHSFNPIFRRTFRRLLIRSTCCNNRS